MAYTGVRVPGGHMSIEDFRVCTAGQHHVPVQREPLADTPAHPAPIVASRRATDDELPRTARAALAKADANYWLTQADFAKGTSLKASAEVVESVVLRFQRDDRRVVAYWVAGKFSSAWAWPGVRRLSSKELTAELLTEPAALPKGLTEAIMTLSGDEPDNTDGA